MFDKWMLDLVFDKENELPKPKLYQRMGRFYFTRDQTRHTLKELQRTGYLGIKVKNKQLFYVKRK